MLYQLGVNPPADIASGRIAEVRSRSMSCNCMTRTSQQECKRAPRRSKAESRWAGACPHSEARVSQRIIEKKQSGIEVCACAMKKKRGARCCLQQTDSSF